MSTAIAHASSTVSAAGGASRAIDKPVFGFLAFTSGAMEGAIIRDMRLANELHRRGFKVFVYWMMERNPSLVDPAITQRIVATGGRYHFSRPSRLMDYLSRAMIIFFGRKRMRRFIQQHPAYLHYLMRNCCRAIVDGDPGFSRRLSNFIQKDRVTHLLPTFAMICPFAQAAQARADSRGKHFDYLVTFQGEEIFANFASHIGRLNDYHARLRQAVDGSPWPAIAVSRDYIDRLSTEMNIDHRRLVPIYPGIELPPPPPPRDGSESLADRPEFATARKLFKSLRPDLPIVTYLGRQDPEKGIDLLLYACKILAQRGIQLQLLCVGGASFGDRYEQVCRQITEHLRLRVFTKRRVSNEARDALYRISRCIVYPSIHREPFGLVAAETMSHGTPVLVPDLGGITEAIEANGQRGGITFRSWDSGDLADKLQSLLENKPLYDSLAASARSVAENFSVSRMTDRILQRLDLMPLTH